MSSGTLFRSSPGRLETEPGTSRPLFASVGASVHGVAFGFIYESKRLKVGGGLIYRETARVGMLHIAPGGGREPFDAFARACSHEQR